MADHWLDLTATTFACAQFRVARTRNPNHRRAFVIMAAITLIDIRFRHRHLRDLLRADN